METVAAFTNEMHSNCLVQGGEIKGVDNRQQVTDEKVLGQLRIDSACKEILDPETVDEATN